MVLTARARVTSRETFVYLGDVYQILASLLSSVSPQYAHDNVTAEPMGASTMRTRRTSPDDDHGLSAHHSRRAPLTVDETTYQKAVATNNDDDDDDVSIICVSNERQLLLLIFVFPFPPLDRSANANKFDLLYRSRVRPRVLGNASRERDTNTRKRCSSNSSDKIFFIYMVTTIHNIIIRLFD